MTVADVARSIGVRVGLRLPQFGFFRMQGPARTTDPDRSDRQAVVAVLEVEPTGHRLQYLRHLVEAAGTRRCVVLTSERAVRSEEYAAHATSINAATVVLPGTSSRRGLLAAAVSQAHAAAADRLVVPEGDLYLLPLLVLLIRHPRLALEVRLLLMRTTTIGGPEKLRPAMIVKPVLTQLLRLFGQVRVLFLTDALGVVTRRAGFAGVRAVRDPIVLTEEVAHERPAWFPPADPDTTLVGVFGVISGRKNVPLLVEAMASAPAAVVVVGGRLEPDVAQFVDSAQVRALISAGRMAVLDRLLAPAEFAAALASVDLVAVLHDNDAPSGILAEACARHTPVIVPTGCWLGRVVESTGLGVATPLTGPAVGEGIRRVARDRPAYVEAARRYAPRMGTVHFTDGLLGSRDSHVDPCNVRP